MSYIVVDNIVDVADEIRVGAGDDVSLCRLSDGMAAQLEEARLIRLPQHEKGNGYETHPREFTESVTKIIGIYGPAGCVGGHLWQLAFAGTQVQDEVLGTDGDIWQASRYMPGGIAVRPLRVMI
ncbi:hypothetical protein ACRS6B_26905 [Nocardia asteroides]